MRVLLAERAEVAGTVQGLRRQGYDVHRVTTGTDTVRDSRRADVVVLDLDLPDRDGLRLCADIRATSDVPVLALSGDRTEATRVGALRAGADDCIDKPYGFRELVARVEAIVRRATAGGAEPAPITVIDQRLRLDPVTRQARVGDRDLGLTGKEFDLLQLLVARAGTVVGRDEIMARVWADPWNRRSRTVDTHVGSLRRKLGHDDWIVTLRGVGFRFAALGSE
ncbi:response regulator transcription factor [Micromonospora sp. WMMD730]|uniref:response regulator transcription factor n=1 Tax=Micromonospora sp. WMMD730 TaxID=3404128 RepID=UPI003B92833F